MLRIRHLLLACLAACSGPAQTSADTAAVQVVDRAGRPIAGAAVWSLPSAVWNNLGWIPAELAACCGNPHELLRQLGNKLVADQHGIVRVPHNSAIAGEHEGLAGTATVGGVDASPLDLVLDDWHWTIVVRDQTGAPVPGVPVACRPEDEESLREFMGIPLGLTDAEGRLVVLDPASVHVARYQAMTVGSPAPAPPRFVSFEVEGMYLRAHAKQLSLIDRECSPVELTLPPVTRIEVRLPEWRGPLAEGVELSRRGKGYEWDTSGCWGESGRLLGLVGTDAKLPTWICAQIAGSTIHTNVEVPLLPADQTFVVQVQLAEGDTIVRATVRNAAGEPARSCVFSVTPRSDALRTWYVRADREGRIALVVRPEADGADLALAVLAAPRTEWLDANAKLSLHDLHAGEHRDLGAVTLTQ